MNLFQNVQAAGTKEVIPKIVLSEHMYRAGIQVRNR